MPGSVWGKPGPLTANEQERVRLHVYYVERIFNRPEPLRRIGLLAATHHERMDGSGYHRGVGGTMLSSGARVLAVADAYSAMTATAPVPGSAERGRGRPASCRQTPPTVASIPIATDAVLAAAGHRVSRTRAGGPAGLTTRESEVLALLAQGMPNKGIARELGISPKTVSNHVEHVYTKLGVSNRTGAAMYAMQYGIVGSRPTLSELSVARTLPAPWLDTQAFPTRVLGQRAHGPGNHLVARFAQHICDIDTSGAIKRLRSDG